MSSYAEMACQRKQAHSLYLELRVLDLGLYTEEDPQDLTGYRVVLEGLCSLSEAHQQDRLMRPTRRGEQARSTKGLAYPVRPGPRSGLKEGSAV